MITKEEIVDLLTLAAGYDRRTVGLADVEAWEEVAARSDWTFATAGRALVEHFQISDRPIMPANINAILAAVRKQVRAQFTEDVCPPRELRDDPRAEIAWRRQRVADYMSAALAAWAERGRLPELDQRVALGERERPQLAAAVSSLAGRMMISREPRPAPPVVRRTAMDRARLRAVREELANRPPVALPDADSTESGRCAS